MHKTPLSQQRGATIFEILVSVLILSFGILALVGLQARSLSAASDAKYRIEATNYADQIVGQMWADRLNIANYPTFAAPEAAAWRAQESAQAALSWAWVRPCAPTSSAPERFAPVSRAPFMRAPPRYAPTRVARSRFALLKSAPEKRAPKRFAIERSALAKRAPSASASERSAWRRREAAKERPRKVW